MKRVEKEDLEDLFCNRKIFIYIKNYFDIDFPNSIVTQLSSLNYKDAVTNSIYLSQQVPFFNASLDKNLMSKILKENLMSEKNIDDIFYPYASPLVVFARNLDHAWPHGIKRIVVFNKRYPYGIVRVWPEKYFALPHQDVIRRETNASWATKIKTQIAFNLYLTDSVGGNLKIWNKKISDLEWKTMNIKGSYGFNTTEAAEITLHPGAGDLIMLNSEYLHAIDTIENGKRVTLSGFLAYFDHLKPIRIWS